MFEHPLNEYKERARQPRASHDFYEIDPKRGFYGGGGHRRALRSAIRSGYALDGLPPDADTGGSTYKQRFANFPRTMYMLGAHDHAAGGDEQCRRSIRS